MRVELKFKSASEIINSKKKNLSPEERGVGRTQIQIMESNHELQKKKKWKNFLSPVGVEKYNRKTQRNYIFVASGSRRNT